MLIWCVADDIVRTTNIIDEYGDYEFNDASDTTEMSIIKLHGIT